MNTQTNKTKCGNCCFCLGVCSHTGPHTNCQEVIPTIPSVFHVENPTQDPESWEVRFDEYFYDSTHSLKESQVEHIKKNLVAPLLQAQKHTIRERVERLLNVYSVKAPEASRAATFTPKQFMQVLEDES